MGRMHHTSPIASLYDVSCYCFSTSSYAVRNATAAELKESECPAGLPLPATRTTQLQSDCEVASSSCSDHHRASVASDSSSCASAGLYLHRRESASAYEPAGTETSATLSSVGGQCQQSSSMSTTFMSIRQFSQIHGGAVATTSWSSLGNDVWGLAADEPSDDLEPQLVIKNTFFDLVLPPSRNQPRRSKSMPHSASCAQHQHHDAAPEQDEQQRPWGPSQQSLAEPEEAASTQVPVPDVPPRPQPWQAARLAACLPVPAWTVVAPCPAVAVVAGAAAMQQYQQQQQQQPVRFQLVEQRQAGAQDDELEGDADGGKHRQAPTASETQAQDLISEACAAFREYRQSPVWALSRKDRDSSALVQKAIDLLAQELSMAKEEGDRRALDAGSFRVEALLSGMHGHVHTALEHPHANYVVQKVVDVLPIEHLAFVITELRGKALWASKHRFGCRTILRLVPHTRAAGWIGAAASQLLDEIMPYADELACDKFGNYVMQEVVEYGTSYHKRGLTRALLSGGIASSATTQHGSRVIEKALRMCDAVDVEALASALLGNRRVVQRLTSSEYGCLVLKPLVKSEEYARRSALVLRPWVPELRKTRQGRRLLSSVFGNSEPID